MWELDYKASWAPKNWCFWTVVLVKTLENPLDCKEIQPVHPKGDQSWVFIGRSDIEAETPILWPLDGKNWLIWKDPDAGKDWGQEEKGTTEDEMVGWHHRLNGHEFGWALGIDVGQGGLACCSSWGHEQRVGHDWVTELNWTQGKYMTVMGSWVWAPKDKGTLQKEGLLAWKQCWGVRRTRLHPPTLRGIYSLIGMCKVKPGGARVAPWFVETSVNHLKRVEQRTWQGQVGILDKSHWPVYFEGSKVKVQKQLLNGHTNGIQISWRIRLAPVNYKLALVILPLGWLNHKCCCSYWPSAPPEGVQGREQKWGNSVFGAGGGAGWQNRSSDSQIFSGADIWAQLLYLFISRKALKPFLVMTVPHD